MNPRLFVPRSEFKIRSFEALLPPELAKVDVYWFDSCPTIVRLFDQDWDSEENLVMESQILGEGVGFCGWPRSFVEKYDQEAEY
ncbi:MAG: hypothetical protein IPK50_18740 [Fibrobacterota bacterium]|nr:MAG: hypothetical protein IPK50_18740 [Fibrobacterota bacterium]